MTTDRLKPREHWTVDEILHHARTGEKPESEGYLEARAAALESAGVELRPDDELPKPTDEQSVADHIRRQQKDSR